MLRKFDAWHKTKTGFAVLGLIELVLAYLITDLAIDSGSLVQWTLAIVLGLGAIQNFVKLCILTWKKG